MEGALMLLEIYLLQVASQAGPLDGVEDGLGWLAVECRSEQPRARKSISEIDRVLGSGHPHSNCMRVNFSAFHFFTETSGYEAYKGC